MDVETRKNLIEQYRDGYRVVADALVGATDEERQARPAPGKWCPREIVHHLADSETTAAVRLRTLLAVDNAQIVGYDQDEFARRLHYDRPIEASLEVLKAVRRSTAELLDVMTEAEWLREGTHTEHGRYSVARWLEIYAAHTHNHAAQIRAAVDLARKKKPA
jgi:DinB family protein